MVDAVHGLLLLMDGHDRFADVVRRDNVDSIVRAQRKDRQAREQIKSLHHIELRGFRAAAIAHYDGWAKNCARHIRQKLGDHVLAKFLGACVWIVIRAGPIDGGIFGYDFVPAMTSNGHRGDVGIAAQSLTVLHAARELNYFQGTAQIDVEALLFGFSIQRGGAVNDGVCGLHQGGIVLFG
jgi:hypothetical protein